MIAATATTYNQIFVFKRKDKRNKLRDEIRENEARENRLKQQLPQSRGDVGYGNPNAMFGCSLE